MTREQAYVILTDLFHDVFDDDGIAPTDAMTSADLPGWDSIAQIELLAAAEIRFGIEIRAADGDRLGTVGDFVDLVLAKVASGTRKPRKVPGGVA
jgi:acyl carrier protein